MNDLGVGTCHHIGDAVCPTWGGGSGGGLMITRYDMSRFWDWCPTYLFSLWDRGDTIERIFRDVLRGDEVERIMSFNEIPTTLVTQPPSTLSTVPNTPAVDGIDTFRLNEKIIGQVVNWIIEVGKDKKGAVFADDVIALAMKFFYILILPSDLMSSNKKPPPKEIQTIIFACLSSAEYYLHFTVLSPNTITGEYFLTTPLKTVYNGVVEYIASVVETDQFDLRTSHTILSEVLYSDEYMGEEYVFSRKSPKKNLSYYAGDLLKRTYFNPETYIYEGSEIDVALSCIYVAVDVIYSTDENRGYYDNYMQELTSSYRLPVIDVDESIVYSYIRLLEGM